MKEYRIFHRYQNRQPSAFSLAVDKKRFVMEAFLKRYELQISTFDFVRPLSNADHYAMMETVTIPLYMMPFYYYRWKIYEIVIQWCKNQFIWHKSKPFNKERDLITYKNDIVNVYQEPIPDWVLEHMYCRNFTRATIRDLMVEVSYWANDVFDYSDPQYVDIKNKFKKMYKKQMKVN
jgi:hypothetical protein